VLILLTYLLESPVLYVNYIRCSLFEAIDLSEKVSQENFAEIQYILSPNYNDNFFGLADYNGIDYGSADYDTSPTPTPIPTPTRIHTSVYSSVYN